MTQTQARPLWWEPDHLSQVKAAIAAGDPDALFLEQQTRARTSGGEEDGCFGLEPRAVCAWLDHNPDAAREILSTWREKAVEVPNSNLGEAAWSLSGALLLDMLAGLVTAEDREATAATLWTLTRRLRAPGRGNPHIVTNNWWAVTHSGALCGALAALRYGTPETPGFDPDTVPLCLGRLRAFCHHFGPAGLYHEGLGYIRYTCMFLLSAITAAQSQGVADILTEFPSLRNLLPSLYAASTARNPQDDDTDAAPKSGASLSWNDMGSGAGICVVDHIGIAIAPEALRPSLNAWFHRAFGREADYPSLGGHHGCIPMAWAFRPVGLPRPKEICLPLEVQDSRQGFWICRNRYQDANDSVFGLYAKPAHPGGHKHDDAGSIRLEAFGVDWIAGPGQARPAKEGQSVMFPADDPSKNQNLAYLNFQERVPAGLVAGMEMRKTSGAYHERYVACRWDTPQSPPLSLAVFDQIDDHREREWIWTWTFSSQLKAEIDADGHGAVLRTTGNQNRMTAQIRFLLAKPTRLEISELPASKRTFSNGKLVHYRGKPFLRAVFDPAPHLPVLAVAVWQADTPAEISGDLFRLQTGNCTWERPFGGAVPNGFQPGKSPGPSQRADP